MAGARVLKSLQDGQLSNLTEDQKHIYKRALAKTFGKVLVDVELGQQEPRVVQPHARERADGLSTEDVDSEEVAPPRRRPTVGAGLEAGIHRHATIQADGLYERGVITRDERKTLSEALGRALDRYVRVVEAKAPQVYRISKRGYSAPGGASMPSVGYAAERLVAKSSLDATLKKLSDVTGVTPRQILDDLSGYMRRNDINNPSKEDVHDFVVESYGSGEE
jgi:hypothetical protein